jgi:hypothetical protein
VGWPSDSMTPQARIAQKKQTDLATANTRPFHRSGFLAHFEFGLRVSYFKATLHRGEISQHTDFRKFDGGMMMTVNCSAAVVGELRSLLKEATAAKIIRFDMQLQDETLMTYVVPSIQNSDHMHFVDGADGSYPAAARHFANNTNRKHQ